MKKIKISSLQAFLTVLFVVCLLISNIIAGKVIQLPFDITMTSAVIVFPITYILSDVFSEVYGYKWSRLTCYLAFAMNLFMVIIFTLSIKIPAAVWWGNQGAFEIVLGNTPRILLASLSGFVIGDFINDNVFKKLKEKHPNNQKGFGFRAILSSLAGQAIDSAIFLPIAFFGQMPLQALFIMAVTQITLKVLYEIIILPVTTLVVKKVANYESV